MGGTPLTTMEMKDSANFQNYDFDSIWDIDDGYPFLRGVGEGGNMAVSNETPQDHPSIITLKQNYPNPFNPSTVISFNLKESSTISLRIFNMLGREVVTLIDKDRKSSGLHNYTFNAENLSSGIYIYRLETDKAVLTKKLTLIK
jgi:hypothetical protein